MNRLILIKYGELTTKKGNRNFFIKTLTKNIEHKLSNFDVKIKKDLSRMCIYFNDCDLKKIIDTIKDIFGIHAYHVAYITNTNIDDIASTVLELLKFSLTILAATCFLKSLFLDSADFTLVSLLSSSDISLL